MLCAGPGRSLAGPLPLPPASRPGDSPSSTPVTAAAGRKLDAIFQEDERWMLVLLSLFFAKPKILLQVSVSKQKQVLT